MIKNEKQLRNTMNVLHDLQGNIACLEDKAVEPSKEWMKEAQKQALMAQMLEFQHQIEVYLGYKTRKIVPQSLELIKRIPALLIQWRIYQGMTQQELAERLDWHYQQLQQYEKTDYATATLETIFQVVDALSEVAVQHRTTELHQQDKRKSKGAI